MSDLTDQQTSILYAVRDADAPPSAKVIGEEFGITENAARKKLRRLAERTPGLVERIDGGQEWQLTAAGHQLVGYKPRVESGNGDWRSYTVLERVDVPSLVRRLLRESPLSEIPPDLIERVVQWLPVNVDAFVVAGEPTARNTEHAFRQVAKTVYAQRDTDDDEIVVPSVAVDGKRWKIVDVKVQTTPTVTLG